MELWSEVGRLVRDARVGAGFKTQTELARVLPNVKQNTLSAIERGSMHPTLGTLAEIAGALGVPLNSLVPGPRDSVELRTLLKDPGRQVAYRGSALNQDQKDAILLAIDGMFALVGSTSVSTQSAYDIRTDLWPGAPGKGVAILAVEPKEKAPAPEKETDASQRIGNVPPIERIAALHSTERDLAEAPTTPDERAEEGRALGRAERAELERRQRQDDAGN